MGVGCTRADTLTCLTNAADELARGGRGRGRDGGDDAVAGAQGSAEPAALAIPPALTQKWPELTSLQGTPAYNVGRVYAAFAADLDNGTHAVPDFADAVPRHEVIDAIERSAASGERIKP